MEYEAILSPEAEDTFRDFSYLLQEAIAHQITKLESDPSKYSRKSHFPHIPGGNVSVFDFVDPEGEHHWFSIRFFFGSDEKTLKIVSIGHWIVE